MQKLTVIGLSWLVVLWGSGRADAVVEPTRYEFTQIVMGGSAHLVMFADSDRQAHDAARAAFARLNELDAVMSDYRSDSELMRLCSRPAGEPVRVSEDLARVLAAALDVSEKTDGAFDVTVGPLVQLWRRARQTATAPAADDLKTARAAVGFRWIDLNPEQRTVRLNAEHMRLDLGGIGKGFAADEAIRVLSSFGIDRALVDLGGDIVVSAPPPGQDGWRVLIDDGVSEPYTIRLSHAAVATSGDLEQHAIIDGVRYSHIVDPRSGQALTGGAAATVLASSGTLADALASAACVIGPGALAGFEAVEGVVARQDGAGGDESRVTWTAGMPQEGERWGR